MSPTTLRARFSLRLLAALLVFAGALWQLGLMLRIFAARVTYPWDVEWLESSALYQAYRVKEGLSTYGPYKAGYIPLAHPPVYPAFLGYLGKVLPLGYPMARALSLAFFVATAALVVRAILRHTGKRLEGWALAAFAVATAAAGIPFTGGFYDLVREDMMSVFFCVLVAVLADTAPRLTPRRIAVLGALITLIVYTRHPVVFLPVWVVLWSFLRHRRSGLLVAVAAAAGCGLTLVALQLKSKGYYWLLTVALLQEHGIHNARFLGGMGNMLRFAPFLAAIPVVVVILAVLRRLSASSVLWVGLLVASIPASLLPYAKEGGFMNDFVPTVFLAGPAAAFLAADFLKAIERGDHPRWARVFTAVLASGALYLGLRHYPVDRWIPSASQRRQAGSLNAKVASLKGGVVCSRHPFLPIQNGHKTLQWSDMPYLDLAWSGVTDINLGGYLEKANARYAVISAGELGLTQRELVARYQYEGPLPEAPGTLFGEGSMMRHLLRQMDGESGARVLFDFEKDLTGWTQTGDAFRVVPPHPRFQGAIAGVVGNGALTSYHPTQKDGATGTLVSPRFRIDRRRMAFRLGGWHPATRIELRVDGKAVRTASGIFQYAESLLKQVWDVSPWMGKDAELWVIDEDKGPWGHLILDHVILL